MMPRCSIPTGLPRAARCALAGVCWLLATGCSGPPIQPGVATSRPAATTVTETASPTALSDEPAALYHQVKAGEKLSDIAALYGQTAQRLLQVNGLDVADGVQPGQLLFIPRSP